ncbi:MAG: lipase [Microbacterium sp. 14-71-5]|jgi:acetyl esterase/lipase|uniref:alpha/beta hydrolase n=1 Tax=Microbacterium sp. 13-71-7 TaxID=1970399 RepID=UPI000BD448B6|nr:alpha/beta hydrolase [Microbacterium sp. 13-71-7]OZB83156.1 MAG: lipase [Microbacterium sp. 13-71-7]OZB87859.1 MAG: lipase [Microbacterium sp. 14-71-5]
MTSTLARPPFDPELEAVLTLLGDQIPPSMTPEMIPVVREGMTSMTPGIDDLLADRPLTQHTVEIPGYRGDTIEVTVIRRTDHTGLGPEIYHTHGGGMVIGDRFAGIEPVLAWVEKHDAVAVTVEYRLAPEFPDPYPVEDSYAGLVWTARNAAELGIDASRLIVFGTSAGGGLAAGISLLARDRRTPAIAGQVLQCPMLDDRDATVSTRQIEGVGVWDRNSNITGWSALLGDRRAGDDVSIYAAPARAVDLAGLPPAFISCGSAEVFRDEDVAYASAIWAAGGQAELHVWPGGFHGSEMLAPHARISQQSNENLDKWVARILAA